MCSQHDSHSAFLLAYRAPFQVRQLGLITLKNSWKPCSSLWWLVKGWTCDPVLATEMWVEVSGDSGKGFHPNKKRPAGKPDFLPLHALVRVHTLWAEAAILQPWRVKPESNSQYSEDGGRWKQRDLDSSWLCLSSELTPESSMVDLSCDMLEPAFLVGIHCVHLPILP